MAVQARAKDLVYCDIRLSIIGVICWKARRKESFTSMVSYRSRATVLLMELHSALSLVYTTLDFPPDLTICDNALWGFIKSIVAQERYDAVRRAFQQNTPAMLRRISGRQRRAAWG
ncbi:hypothetical protein ANN_01664 [Periplaneta americana]|uniref:Uncharacterized protein n=1 Tax=Periplaneta americana TaxID=6978 RepID=A0ABQ8TX68_PERAM|nr:hypothetical protein ANN_01664 [Periplaneta americana]